MIDANMTIILPLVSHTLVTLWQAARFASV
jgi:hypothetical protein